MLVTGGVASLTPGYRLASLSGLPQPVDSLGIQTPCGKVVSVLRQSEWHFAAMKLQDVWFHPDRDMSV
jgi:hypothetical protein